MSEHHIEIKSADKGFTVTHHRKVRNKSGKDVDEMYESKQHAFGTSQEVVSHVYETLGDSEEQKEQKDGLKEPPQSADFSLSELAKQHKRNVAKERSK